MTRDKIFREIRAERSRQDAKWGKVSTRRDAPWLAILMEEVGEVATETMDEHSINLKLEEELIQVAAVAVAWLESR